MNLVDVMNSLYDKFGYYCNEVKSYTFEGAQGMEKMAQIMDTLRQNPPKTIGDFIVTAVSDYKTSKIAFTDGKEEKSNCRNQMCLPLHLKTATRLSSDRRARSLKSRRI